MPLKKWWEHPNSGIPENAWRYFEDFRAFLALVWRILNLPRPTPVQYDIAYHLQHGPRRFIVEAFRGVGKSWIAAAFVVWSGLRDPDIKVEVVSASRNLADNMSTFILEIIKNIEFTRHLEPRDDQRSSKLEFDFGPASPAKDPSVKSAGIFGQITGSRADLLLADDIEIPNTSETPGMRAKLRERVKEFDAILKPGGRVLMLGTPQTEDSVYNVLAERGYRIMVWPANYPDDDEMLFYGDRLAPRITRKLTRKNIGHPTDPDRFDIEDLAERKLSYGRSGYALQFMLNTSPSDVDRFPLRLSDLIVTDLDPEVGPQRLIWANDSRNVLSDLLQYNVGRDHDRFVGPMEYGRNSQGIISYAPYTGRAMFIDPSGRGRDETAYCVLFMLNSTIFLMEQGGFRDGYGNETLGSLAKIAKRWKVNVIRVESNYGDGMFSALLKPVLIRAGYPCTIEDERSSGMKEARIIDTLEPVMNQHRLVVNKQVVIDDYLSTKELPVEKQNNYRLFYQMTRMVKEKGCLSQDDRIDILAQGCAYWSDQMSVDADSRVRETEQEAIEAMCREFVERYSSNISQNTYAHSWLNLPDL